MWGIIGLGNPGDRYAHTRHNIGFEVVDVLARRLSAKNFEAGDERFGVRSQAGAHPFILADARIDGTDVVLVKPTTYVNRSGAAVSALLRTHEALDLHSILVIIDDVALPFGRLRLRASGSAGGHNGLRSIETALESRDYARLRLGVGAQKPGEDLAEHVLGPFEADEVLELPGILERAALAVESVVRDGVEVTLSRVNGREPQDREESRDEGDDAADGGPS